MTQKKIVHALNQCREALEKLAESLHVLKKTKDNEIKEILTDACIKRFEILFEYAWKLLKICVEFQGQEAPGPRPAIQEASRFGWIKDLDLWADALDARNGSVHDYFGISHTEYVKLIERFSDEIKLLLPKLEKVK